jgi:hypothetical protein
MIANYSAVVGAGFFHGYSQAFFVPIQETKTKIKLYQAGEHIYISICSPSTCSPYCCRKSKLLGFLLHVDCVMALRKTFPISMRAIWTFGTCIQPSYLSSDSFGTAHQIRSIATAIAKADLASLPQLVSSILHRVQQLPVEIQILILGSAGPSIGLSLLTAVLDTLPLLQDMNTLAGKEDCFELDCSVSIFAEFRTIRGRSYLSNLSHKKGHDWHIIYRPPQAEHLILSLDDLGIISVCFAAEEPKPEPTVAQWYMCTKLCVDVIVVKKNVRNRCWVTICLLTWSRRY